MTAESALKMMLYGFIIAEQVFIAVCFFRFWRSSGERIFAFFTAGFVVMGIHRVLLGLAVAGDVRLELQTPVFLIRLLSYVLIFAGVVAKNISRRRAG